MNEPRAATASHPSSSPPSIHRSRVSSSGVGARGRSVHQRRCTGRQRLRSEATFCRAPGLAHRRPASIACTRWDEKDPALVSSHQPSHSRSSAVRHADVQKDDDHHTGTLYQISLSRFLAAALPFSSGHGARHGLENGRCKSSRRERFTLQDAAIATNHPATSRMGAPAG